MGTILSRAFGAGSAVKKVKAEPLPEVKKPAPMPDEEELKRKAAYIQARKPSSGRESTIFTDYERLG